MAGSGKIPGHHSIDQMVAILQQRASEEEEDAPLQLEVYRAWEALMASCYREALELCGGKCRSLLEESQRNWLKYRDGEYNCLDTIYSFRVSPVNLRSAAQSKNELIRIRALQLYEYRKILRKIKGNQPDK